MQPTRTATSVAPFAVIAFLFAALAFAPAHAGGERRPARHFDLVNATFDDVTALAIAPNGSDSFHDIPLGEPLQGGLTSITIDVPAGGCLRDIRVTFRDGRTLLYPHIDACRYHGLRLMPHDGRPDPAVTSPPARPVETANIERPA